MQVQKDSSQLEFVTDDLGLIFKGQRKIYFAISWEMYELVSPSLVCSCLDYGGTQVTGVTNDLDLIIAGHFKVTESL